MRMPLAIGPLPVDSVRFLSWPRSLPAEHCTSSRARGEPRWEPGSGPVSLNVRPERGCPASKLRPGRSRPQRARGREGPSAWCHPGARRSVLRCQPARRIPAGHHPSTWNCRGRQRWLPLGGTDPKRFGAPGTSSSRAACWPVSGGSVSRASCRALGAGREAATFYGSSLLRSSQIFGSQSSTLLPSGSMIHANLPFS